MGIEPFLTASAVDCVVAQRLARRLCTLLQAARRRSADALQAAGFEAEFDIEAYEPVGCARCSHSGYKGRVGLYEVMTVSDEIRALTIERASADVIREIAIEQGMCRCGRRPGEGPARRHVHRGGRAGRVDAVLNRRSS